MHYRFVPTSFDPDDPTSSVVRFSASWQWESLAETLARYNPHVLLLRLPLFWQVLSPLHAVCKRTGCALYINEQENPAAGEAAARVGEANVVITDAKDAFSFSLYVAERNVHIPSWILIHDPTGDWEIPIILREEHAQVAQEVHLFPGIPLLIQCEALAREKLPFFHMTGSIETLFDLPITYALEPKLISSGICTCGKEILGRTHKSNAHL